MENPHFRYSSNNLVFYVKEKGDAVSTPANIVGKYR
jgi:hypothetical protein